MNWWQTLVVSVVPVLLTLVITNVAETRRRREDAVQREKDRVDDAAKREEERRAAIEDHWRNERLTRMTALVDVVSQMTRRAIDIKFSIQWADDTDDDLRKAMLDEAQKDLTQFNKAKEGDLTESVTSVSVIASQRFYVETLSILDQIRNSSKGLLMAVFKARANPENLATAVEALTELSDKMALINTRLINLVREELTGDNDSWIRSVTSGQESPEGLSAGKGNDPPHHNR